ncbi:MAG: hypothetical protein K5751_07815 [Treponemataceae bacterium]|nr:hypothetical protein [Treponemataceae bacterium]
MKFMIDMSKEEFRALYDEIDRSENPALMEFYIKISKAAIRQAEEKRKDAESILSINEIDSDMKLLKENKK